MTDSLGAILHKQPDWEQLPAETPPTVRLLLRRCLTKDRKRRLRDIGDVKIELEAAIADPTSSVLGLTNTALPIDRKAHWMGRGFAVNVGIALLAAVLTIVIGRSFWATAPAVEARPPAPVERFTITLPQRESKITVPVDYRTFSVANDGKVLVYMATKDPVGVNFFQRSLDQVEPVQIASSDKIRMPTLSPDGRWLAYHDNDQKTLLKKSIIGGPATTLCQDHDIVGITWADDGFITFTDFGRPNTLLRINEVGGEVTELKLSGSEERWTRIVHALPGGQAILYSAFEGQLSANRGSIGVFSLETGQAKQLIQDGIYPLYSQSGHLLFLRDSTLMAAPFDATTLEITGQVVPVPGLQKVSTGQWGNAYIDITDTGTLYYHEDREQASTLRGIYRYPLEGGGKPELISPRTGYFERFSISSDCRFIAVEIGEGRFNQNESIWVLDLERNVLQQVTTEPGPQVAPVISPDGRWIYYAAEGDDEEWSGLYRRQRGDHSIDGAELIDDGPRACYPISMSPDGKYLLVAEASDSKLSPETSWDIGLISLGEDGAKATRTVWAGGPEFEYEPKISPNGRHVAYSAWRIGSSKSDVYVRPLDSSVDGNSVYQVSINGGSDAMWSPDGKTIYYVESVDPNTPKKMMAAAVLDDTHQTTADGKLAKFAIGEVTELFDFSVFQGSREHLEIMPDGSGILRNDAVPQEGNEKAHDDPTVIHVVRNFFTELDRVAPTEEGRRE